MTRGTADEYWANTAEGHFESMSSTYQPGERAGLDPAPRQIRRGLPRLTASQGILDAIAACVPPREAVEQAPQGSAVQQGVPVAAK